MTGRITALTLMLVCSTALVGGCAGGGDPSADDVVEPGLTSVDPASAAACDAAADALRTAIAAVAAEDGQVADSQAQLVAAGHLAEESALFDVAAGQLVAVDPACKAAVPVTAPSGSAPLTAPATDVGDIITDDEPLTPDELLATMTADDIAAFGGERCAAELAAIVVAGQTFTMREQRDPRSLDELAGDLAIEPTLWTLDEAGQVLVPAAGSPCPDVLG